MDQRVGTRFKERGVRSNQNYVKGRRSVVGTKREVGGVSPFNVLAILFNFKWKTSETCLLKYTVV